MENVTKAIYMAAALMTFIAGVTFFMYVTRCVSTLTYSSSEVGFYGETLTEVDEN